MVYGSISTQKPRATHLFSSSLPRNKPAMTRQTSHSHATRFAHSDFNRFFLCTTFAGKLQTCFKIARCLQFSCKCYTKLNFTCSSPANMLQNYMMLAAFLQISHKTALYLQDFSKYIAKTLIICRASANMLQKCILLAETPASMLQKCALFAELPANDAQNEKMLAAISANTTRHRAPPSAQQLALTSRRHT